MPEFNTGLQLKSDVRSSLTAIFATSFRITFVHSAAKMTPAWGFVDSNIQLSFVICYLSTLSVFQGFTDFCDLAVSIN
jgi:hypothetical protein